MNKECRSCKKKFIPKKEKSIFCSLKCFNNRNKRKIEPKFDLKQLFWDVMIIIVPILILAFMIFKITPKESHSLTEQEIEAIKEIPESSCEDFELIDEDMKFRDFLFTKR